MTHANRVACRTTRMTDNQKSAKMDTVPQEEVANETSTRSTIPHRIPTLVPLGLGLEKPSEMTDGTSGSDDYVLITPEMLEEARKHPVVSRQCMCSRQSVPL